jgi:HK97 family phage portal protein
MTFGKRISGWLRRLTGIRADTFISVDEIQQGRSGAGKVGQGMDSNVVMAPIQFIQRTFTQSVPIVEEKADGRKWTPLDEHPLEALLAEPNPFYDGDTLAKAYLLSWFIDGNAYLLKARNGLRGVAHLWYIPHWLIGPEWSRDGRGPFITHYDFNPDGRGKQKVPVEDVVHLRVGLDPRNPRKGLSPIKAALREVLTDEEASAFSAYLLGNMGVPGGIISPKTADVQMSTDDIADMKAYMKSGFTGKKRGDWAVFGQPTEVQQFGFDPNRLMLGPLRDISEERICAMLGVPAAVVGFGAGLQSTKVGATMRELVKLARVNCIEPTQSTIGRQVGGQLLPDFEPEPELFRVTYDNSGVSMFLEDQDAIAKRSGELYAAGLATRDEARGMVGLDPVGDDDFKTAAPAVVPAIVEPEPEPEPEPPVNRWSEWGDAIIERNGGSP